LKGILVALVLILISLFVPAISLVVTVLLLILSIIAFLSFRSIGVWYAVLSGVALLAAVGYSMFSALVPLHVPYTLATLGLTTLAFAIAYYGGIKQEVEVGV